MWKCKECGGEVFDYEIQKVKSTIFKDKDYKTFKDSDTEDYYFECDKCGTSTQERDLELEDIAEWVD